MKTFNHINEQIFVFHICKGGKFNAPGYLEFNSINNFKDIVLYNCIPKRPNDDRYSSEDLNKLLVTAEEYDKGEGKLDIDGDSDTYYTRRWENCSELEKQLIEEKNIYCYL